MMGFALKAGIGLGLVLGSMYPAFAAATRDGLYRDAEATQPHTTPALADLFDALDFGRPGLTSVATAWKKKDIARAQGELAEYFRTRTSVGWGTETANPPPFSPHSRAIADAAVEGRVQGGMVPITYSFPKGEIDWRFNATYHLPGQAPNDEWQWQLNRMFFWDDLAIAYRATGDERYAKAFVRELSSWIAQCPVPERAENGPGSPWRTIEAGIRSGGSWIDAFYAFRTSPSVSDADLLALIHSLLDHGRYLRKNHTRLNWLTMEMSGLYAIGAVFPEFKEAAEWRAYSTSTLAEEARRQFLPDGGQVELSSSYQHVAIDNIVRIVDVAWRTGNQAGLPSDYLAPLKRAYEWQLDIVAPDRFLPKINDSGPTYLPDVLKKALLYFPNQTAFQWFSSNGRTGAPPPFTSVFLDRSGLAAMRSGWDTDSNYLLFRVGPLGMGHQHQNSLGVSIWAYGRELVFDGGGGSYEKSKWRQWAISAFAHNTVIADDMGQNVPTSSADPFHDPNLMSQSPIDAHWQTNTVFDFASGEYAQGYGPLRKLIATQRRAVLFLKPNIYVIADRLYPNDSKPHQFQARWQLLTTHTRMEPLTHTLITEDKGEPNIAIVPLLHDTLRATAVSGQEEPEILGWDFHVGAAAELAPATTLLHTITGVGPRMFLTLIIPLRPGETDPISSVEEGKDMSSATAMFTDGRRLHISCSGPLAISADETFPDGTTGRSAVGGNL
jgi:hypothetical protein